VTISPEEPPQPSSFIQQVHELKSVVHATKTEIESKIPLGIWQLSTEILLPDGRPFNFQIFFFQTLETRRVPAAEVAPHAVEMLAGTTAKVPVEISKVEEVKGKAPTAMSTPVKGVGGGGEGVGGLGGGDGAGGTPVRTASNAL
jgi:hypothetical protein